LRQHIHNGAPGPSAAGETEEEPMGKVINCECGYTVRGESDEELLANAERHVQDTHPDLVGKISRDQFMAMAEQE
jgi:predicted small metal-binding protein